MNNEADGAVDRAGNRNTADGCIKTICDNYSFQAEETAEMTTV